MATRKADVTSHSLLMNEGLVRRIRSALERSWSAKTSVCYSPSAAMSYGQCAPTAIVVWENFGGEILRTDGWPPNGRHFYNRIDGRTYDFTADQFEMPEYSHKVEYEDILSSVDEAATETLPGQIEEMKRAFGKAFKQTEAG